MTLLAESYRRSLLDQILLRYLHRNVVPTTQQVIDDLNTLMQKYTRLTTYPFSLVFQSKWNRYEEMNINKYNAFFEKIYQDFQVMFSSVVGLAEEASATEQNWNLFYARISKLLKRLEDRVDELLLIKDDTLGYFSYVKDDFLSNEFIDNTTTTARVNTGAGVVTLPPSATQGHFAKTKLQIDSSSVSVTPVVFHRSLSSSTIGAGVQREHILEDNNRPWYLVIETTDKSPEVSVDVVVDLGSDYTFNNMSASVFHGSKNDAVLLTAFYSADGIDWIKAGENASISVVDTGIWAFSEITARYLRFIAIIPSFDNVTLSGNYVWTIGFNVIELFQSTYNETTFDSVSAILQSKSRPILNSLGEAKFFNKVFLEACEILPQDTDIVYAVSVDGTSFSSIGNGTREDSGFSAIIDFGDEKTISSIDQLEGLTSLVDSRSFSENLSIVGIDDVFGNGDAFVNLTISGINLANLIDNTITLFRNKAQRNDQSTVRNNPRGWDIVGEDDALRSTNFVILNPAGLDIDLGPIGAILNGTKVRNKIHIASGNHTFITNVQNWRAVTGNALDDTVLKNIDPLYPYNHKLIIEGYDYSNEDYLGTYPGMDIVAEKIMQYKPVYSYNLVSSADLDSFTYITRGGKLVFVIKVDPFFSDYTNELFELNYRSRSQSFSSIFLRATLSSHDPNFTPILKDYVLKVG